MPIEFRCPQCGTLLRTGDDTAGKQAKCPTCGTVTPIPTESSDTAPPSDFSVPPPPPPPRPGESNPYQSPSQYASSRIAEPAAGDFQPTIIDFGDIFSRTWNIFQQQWGMCLLVLVLTWILGAVIGTTFSSGGALLGLAAGSPVLSVLLFRLGQFVGVLLSIWLAIGQTLIFLDIARGRPVEIGQLFSGGAFFLRVLGGSVLVGSAIVMGLILLIVPGIYLALLLWPFYLLILDRNVGLFDSLGLATKITEGNKGTIFLLLVTAMILIMASAIPCGVGLLFTLPFFALMKPVMYLAMTGQPTADQRSRRM